MLFDSSVASLDLIRQALLYRRDALVRAKKARGEEDAQAVRGGFTCEEQREVEQIDAALKRIQTGSYGHCEGCGRAIGWQRLRAMPETAHCETCSTNTLEGRDR